MRAGTRKVSASSKPGSIQPSTPHPSGRPKTSRTATIWFPSNWIGARTLGSRIHRVPATTIRLPEVLPASNQFSGHRLLHRLHGAGECATFGLTHQKVHVLGHHHVSGDEEFVADS